MPKTHLPAHMDSVRQKLRPKHQLLILKCYPRLPKNSAADVKPNGSELSYLLYYASTRKSKLQKVGVYLEKKTASDVSKSQSARVLVTLQIIGALVENKGVEAGGGFALIAPHVLRITSEVLQNTNDLAVVEASLATWDSFCKHQDQASLAADHEYRGLYESVVKQYAELAHNNGHKRLGRSVQSVASHDAIRLRKAGLGALESVLLSDTLASEAGRQLDVIVPAILSNMRGEDGESLERLIMLSKQKEDVDKANVTRQSMATLRKTSGLTDTSAADADPRQAEGTAQHADELAEEQVAVLALDSLRAVFAGDSNENRAQMRPAASAVLSFIASSHTPEKQPTSGSPSWSTKLFEICTAWTPVQDRFILMVTTVETLVHLPLQGSGIEQQILYTDIIDQILCSDLNMIGLSVMDVLLGLVQQILRVLQLNGPRVAGRGSSTQLFSSDEETKHPTDQNMEKNGAGPSKDCMRLIQRLKECVADLATHVYYTDQISDMVGAILFRLKPNATSTGQANPLASAAAVEEPQAAIAEVASNISLTARERAASQSNGFFSFENARQIALEVVTNVLRVANSSRTMSTGGVAETRNKVEIDIWEGTQWLLRDPSPDVRRAYVEALTTCLQLETKKSDTRIKEPKEKLRKRHENPNGALARRAASNASNKDRQSKRAQNTFLQLLHLAVYENALHYAGDSKTDILLLHLLLTTLVQRLGVNALQSGLPMMFALQDEVPKVESAMGKMRIGSLVHGYFWALEEVFDFDATSVGQDIFKEVKRRKDGGTWTDGLSVPAMSLEQLSNAGDTESQSSHNALDDQGIRPFDDRKGLVDCIAEAYSTSANSPPTSAPGSPSRIATLPSVERSTSYLSAKQAPHAIATTLPDKAKHAMLSSWSKEDILAAVAAKAPSMTGSRSSPTHAFAGAGLGNHRQLLAAIGGGGGAVTSNKNTSITTHTNQPRQPSARDSHANGRLQSQSPGRARSAGGSTSGPADSSSAAKAPTHVADLKRVLAGEAPPTGPTSMRSPATLAADDDTASDSAVDPEDDLRSLDSTGFSAISSSTAPPQPLAPTDGAGTRVSAMPGALPDEDAPPALSLPAGLVTDGHFSPSNSKSSPQASPAPTFPTSPVRSGNPGSPPSARRAPASRGGAASVRSRGRAPKQDLRSLLAGIAGDEAEGQEKEKPRGAVGMEAPPY